MICLNCGKEIDNDLRVCPFCGNLVEVFDDSVYFEEAPSKYVEEGYEEDLAPIQAYARNEDYAEEEYAEELTLQQSDIAFPITVPEGYVFVLGDNRSDSLDSRSTEIGCIDERYIVGKVIFSIVPFGKVE